MQICSVIGYILPDCLERPTIEAKYTNNKFNFFVKKCVPLKSGFKKKTFLIKIFKKSMNTIKTFLL